MQIIWKSFRYRASCFSNTVNCRCSHTSTSWKSSVGYNSCVKALFVMDDGRRKTSAGVVKKQLVFHNMSCLHCECLAGAQAVIMFLLQAPLMFPTDFWQGPQTVTTNPWQTAHVFPTDFWQGPQTVTTNLWQTAHVLLQIPGRVRRGRK